MTFLETIHKKTTGFFRFSQILFLDFTDIPPFPKSDPLLHPKPIFHVVIVDPIRQKVHHISRVFPHLSMQIM